MFTAPAIGLALVGAALAAFKPPGPRTTSAVQHFAAGLAFAAVSLELLPKERSQAALPVIIGFALGLAAMLAIRHVAGAMEKRREGKQFPSGLVAVTAIDFVIDGLVLGVAFASGEQTGLLLSIALAFEVLFLSLSVGAALAGAGLGRVRTLAVPVGLALLFSVSAAVGRLLFGSLAPFPFAILLGVGIVALLYLVTDQLLVEAHEVPETPWAVAAFFLGFLLFLLVEMVVEG